MKKESVSQLRLEVASTRKHSVSAFVNPRIFIGLFMVLAGVFLALAGLGAFSALAQVRQQQHIITDSKDPLVPNGFDCSKIHELGIDKQMNFRAGAIMIACGQAQGGGTSAKFASSGALTQFIRKLLSPLAYGGTDVDLITGDESFPNVTQSETFSTANPDNPNQIVVGYRIHGALRPAPQWFWRIGLNRRRQHLYPLDHRWRSKPLLQHIWQPSYSVQQAVQHLVYCVVGCKAAL